jgi:diguanylate cyclase (GGDEF)-like protein/putative nucleotidyltransferase with HDIG domain
MFFRRGQSQSENHQMRRIEMSDYNRAARAYLGALAILAALTISWAAFNCRAFTNAEWMQLAVLSLLASVANLRPIRVPETTETVNIGDTFIFLGALFLGAPAAVLISVAGAVAGLWRTSKRATTWLGATGICAMTAYLAAYSFYIALAAHAQIKQYPLGRAPLSLEEIALPLVVMSLTHYAVTGLLLAAMNVARRRTTFRNCWRNDYLWTAWTFFASAIATALVYEGVINYHHALLYVITGVPVIGITYASYKIYFERVAQKTREAAEMHRKHLEAVEAHARQAAAMHRLHLATVEALMHKAEAMRDLHLATVEALASAIDAKDQTSHYHVRRVQIYAAEMGKLFKLSEDEIEALKAGALLHDVGKLAVPDYILNKAGKLTATEFEKMKIHATVGAQIVERVNFPYPVAPIVRHHHERWDGKGYPDGLRGEEIPLTARILAVVDCYDTAREDRPWRKGVSREEALTILWRGAGIFYDPRVVEVFAANIEHLEMEAQRHGYAPHTYQIEEENRNEMIEGETWVFSEARSIHISSSGALDRGRLDYFEQIRNAHREVFALYEIARTFSSSLEVEEMAAILVEKIEQVVPSDTCALFLIDECRAEARVAHVSGLSVDQLRGQTITPGSGAIGTLLATGRLPKLLVHPMLDFAHVQFPDDVVYHSMAALPLIKDKRLIGAIAVYALTPNRYDDDHLRLLDTVARLAADALDNALHHAAAQSSALTDALTGLPNKRALYERFDEEAARADRNHTTFQVVMMDLDAFKQVNDSFGHIVGDRFLCQIAHRIQEQLREYDFLARYAGDEFVAFVPELSQPQVEELQKRLEAAVLNFAMPVEAPDESGAMRRQGTARVGISIGAACYGADGTTMDELLRAADEAMYRNKNDHRKQPARAARAASLGVAPSLIADSVLADELSLPAMG